MMKVSRATARSLERLPPADFLRITASTRPGIHRERHERAVPKGKAAWANIIASCCIRRSRRPVTDTPRFELLRMRRRPSRTQEEPQSRAVEPASPTTSGSRVTATRTGVVLGSFGASPVAPREEEIRQPVAAVLEEAGCPGRRRSAVCYPGRR